MEVFRLVPLACGACAHHLLHELTHMGKMEIAAKPVKCALDAFVAILVDGRHDLKQQWRGRCDVEAAVEGHHVVDESPRRPVGARAELIPDGHHSWISGLGLAESLDEVEPRH